MKHAIKATIRNIIVAFLIVISFLGLIKVSLGRTIDLNVALINKIAVKEDTTAPELMKIDLETKKIQNYPSEGQQYATLQIPKIDVNLPVYFGNTLEILKDGVGHDPVSFFPGEGKPILYMGHNAQSVFRRFSELENGDKITINTDYGTFNYEIYDSKLIHETDRDKLPLFEDEEIFMCYTCYPFNNIGYTTQRFIIFAKPV